MIKKLALALACALCLSNPALAASIQVTNADFYLTGGTALSGTE